MTYRFNMEEQAVLRDRVETYLKNAGRGGVSSIERESGRPRETIARFRDGSKVGKDVLASIKDALDRLEGLTVEGPHSERWALLTRELSLLMDAVGPRSPLSPAERIGRVDRFVDGWTAHREAFESQRSKEKDRV